MISSCFCGCSNFVVSAVSVAACGRHDVSRAGTHPARFLRREAGLLDLWHTPHWREHMSGGVKLFRVGFHFLYQPVAHG